MLLAPSAGEPSGNSSGSATLTPRRRTLDSHILIGCPICSLLHLGLRTAQRPAPRSCGSLGKRLGKGPALNSTAAALSGNDVAISLARAAGTKNGMCQRRYVKRTRFLPLGRRVVRTLALTAALRMTCASVRCRSNGQPNRRGTLKSPEKLSNCAGLLLILLMH